MNTLLVRQTTHLDLLEGLESRSAVRVLDERAQCDPGWIDSDIAAIVEAFLRAQFDPGRMPSAQLDPGSRTTAQIDPYQKTNAQVDPGVKTNAQIDPSQKARAQVDSGNKTKAQIDPGD